MSNADDEMSASDQALMQALAEAIGGSPPPVDLVARCEGLLSWIDIDSELAMLLDRPLAEAAGTRGTSPASASLEFAVDDGTCVIELTPTGDALHGQILGAEARQVVVRTAADVAHSLPVDELGNFSFDHPPSGTMRLELELFPEGRRIHTDWFVV